MACKSSPLVFGFERVKPSGRDGLREYNDYMHSGSDKIHPESAHWASTKLGN